MKRHETDADGDGDATTWITLRDLEVTLSKIDSNAEEYEDDFRAGMHFAIALLQVEYGVDR